MVSEFGNWGLPKLPDELPWWFNISFRRTRVTSLPEFLTAFTLSVRPHCFESFNELAEETQWHQFISLEIRNRKYPIL